MEIARTCPLCSGKKLDKSPAVIMPFITYRIFGWEPLVIDDSTGLRSLNNGTAYQLCNSCFCRQCQHIFTDVRFSDAEMNRLYNGYRGREYTEQRQRFEAGYGETNDYLSRQLHYMPAIERFITKYAPSPNIVLDWGGDTGVNTPLSSTAADVQIYDISSKAESKLANGMTLLSDLEGKDGQFDLITAMHVFEHVSHPIDMLVEMSAYIKNGGFVYIEVPLEKGVSFNQTNVGFIKSKFHWHEHINFYCSQSLETLVRQAGLEMVAIQPFDASDDFREFKVQQLMARKP